MEFASCHPSGGQNFEVTARFLENLWKPVERFPKTVYQPKFYLEMKLSEISLIQRPIFLHNTSQPIRRVSSCNLVRHQVTGFDVGT
jgi:hypothetical protein